MLNMGPENKKLLLLLTLLFIFILGVIINDFFINWQNLNSVNLNINSSSLLDDLMAKISTASKNSTSFALRKNINNIFDLMNDKKYEELYNLISDDFKEEIFSNDINNFTRFMSTYVTDKYSPNYDTYERFDNVYMIKVGFIPYSNSDEDIIETKSPEKTDTFILTDLGNNNYCFSFLEYVGKKDINIGKGNSAFSIILNKTQLYRANSKFYITVNNTSDLPIVILPKQIYCYTSLMPRYYNHTTVIPDNSSVDICFYVGTGLSIETALPNTINFNKIKVGDKEYTFSINTKYYQDI